MGKEDEPHIDDLLNGIVRAEKLRRAFLRSAMWRTLYDFEAGDRVQLDLLGVKIDGVHIMQSGRDGTPHGWTFPRAE